MTGIEVENYPVPLFLDPGQTEALLNDPRFPIRNKIPLSS